jgi:hypothetical protein
LTTPTNRCKNIGNCTASLMAAAILLWVQPAAAWNATGHKATAKIAYELLTPEQQQYANKILTAHPRFDEDFLDAMPDEIASGTQTEKNLWLFEQASIWSDIAGGFEDDNRAKFNRSTWHYINMPIYLEEADEKELDGNLDHNVSTDFSPPLRQNLNVTQALKGNLQLWADTGASDAEKALALCWILHLVGDMHQPLHNVALFSRAYYPKGDRGGNSINVQWEDGPKNLHAVWDGLPNNFENLVPGDLTRDILARDNVAIGSINFWAKRHFQMAKVHVYSDDVREQLLSGLEQEKFPDIVLSEFYLLNATEIARSQVILAGNRIATLVGRQ